LDGRKRHAPIGLPAVIARPGDRSGHEVLRKYRTGNTARGIAFREPEMIFRVDVPVEERNEGDTPCQSSCFGPGSRSC